MKKLSRIVAALVTAAILALCTARATPPPHQPPAWVLQAILVWDDADETLYLLWTVRPGMVYRPWQERAGNLVHPNWLPVFGSMGTWLSGDDAVDGFLRTPVDSSGPVGFFIVEERGSPDEAVL